MRRRIPLSKLLLQFVFRIASEWNSSLWRSFPRYSLLNFESCFVVDKHKSVYGIALATTLLQAMYSVWWGFTVSRALTPMTLSPCRLCAELTVFMLDCALCRPSLSIRSTARIRTKDVPLAVEAVVMELSFALAFSASSLSSEFHKLLPSHMILPIVSHPPPDVCLSIDWLTPSDGIAAGQLKSFKTCPSQQ